jgi:hypothetical protein
LSDGILSLCRTAFLAASAQPGYFVEYPHQFIPKLILPGQLRKLIGKIKMHKTVRSEQAKGNKRLH